MTTRYFHADHLGSISVISNANGIVVERLSFDPWGKRRYPNGTDDPAGVTTSKAIRGFTGEEQLSVGGLVHLNGRVYDPLLARMNNSDPTATEPMTRRAGTGIPMSATIRSPLPIPTASRWRGPGNSSFENFVIEAPPK